MKSHVQRVLALLVLVVLAYIPAYRAQFIWDDDAYVVNNMALRSAPGLEAIWATPGTTPQYYPLVHTTFWLEYHAWGLNPAGYHVVNILLHGVNAILLFLLLSRLGVPGAWWAAALFALHPVQVESVAWITERKNVLSTLFYLASALAWFRGEDEPRRRPVVWYAVALALYVAALLSKTVACSLPAALLLVQWWRNGRITGADVVKLVPWFVIGFGMGLNTAALERTHVGAYGAEWALSFMDRCLIAGRAVLFYIGKVFYPQPLMFMYPRWHIDAGAAWQYVAPVLVVVALAATWCLRGRWGRGPFTALAFFVGTLVPALGFFNVYPMRYSFVADHFQYLACAAPLVFVVGWAFRCWPKREATIVAAVAVALCGALTWNRCYAFANAESVWRDTLAKNPSSWMAHNNLGSHLQDRGMLDEALGHYQAALAAKTNSAEALTNIGRVLDMRGQRDEALRYFEDAVKAEPLNAVAQNNLGTALSQRGQLAQGIEHLQVAVSMVPNYGEGHANLGNAYLLQGNARAAAMEYRAAMRSNDRLRGTANNLVWILATYADDSLHAPEEAIRIAESARMQDGDAGSRDTLAAAYAAAGRYPDAVRVGQEALQLAQQAGNKALADTIAVRLQLYSAHKPYVWTPTPASGR